MIFSNKLFNLFSLYGGSKKMISKLPFKKLNFKILTTNKEPFAFLRAKGSLFVSYFGQIYRPRSF